MSDLIKRDAVISMINALKYGHYFECGEYIGENVVFTEIINAEKLKDCIDSLPSTTTHLKEGYGTQVVSFLIALSVLSALHIMMCDRWTVVLIIALIVEHI